MLVECPQVGNYRFVNINSINLYTMAQMLAITVSLDSQNLGPLSPLSMWPRQSFVVRLYISEFSFHHVTEGMTHSMLLEKTIVVLQSYT